MPPLYVWNCLLVNKIDFIPVVVATTLLSSEIYLVRLFFVFLHFQTLRVLITSRLFCSCSISSKSYWEKLKIPATTLSRQQQNKCVF